MIWRILWNNCCWFVGSLCGRINLQTEKITIYKISSYLKLPRLLQEMPKKPTTILIRSWFCRVKFIKNKMTEVEGNRSSLYWAQNCIKQHHSDDQELYSFDVNCIVNKKVVQTSNSFCFIWFLHSLILIRCQL